jgi:hypothetical protein
MVLINTCWTVPANAIGVTLAFIWLLVLVNIGLAVALQVALSLSASGIITTYALSIRCMLLRRLRGQPLPHAPLVARRAGAARQHSVLCSAAVF